MFSIISFFQLADWSSHEQDTKDAVLSKRAEDIQQFFTVLSSCMEFCRRFYERIPGIAEINPGDREHLYQSASLELFILRMAYR